MITLNISKLKEAKLIDINIKCQHEINVVKAGYPENEIASWPKQEAEARALQSNPDSETPLLNAIASARGIDRAELASRVIAKSDQFAAYSGALIGKRQKLEDQINALSDGATIKKIESIKW